MQRQQGRLQAEHQQQKQAAGLGEGLIFWQELPDPKDMSAMFSEPTVP
jgi:hypothetical protein